MLVKCNGLWVKNIGSISKPHVQTELIYWVDILIFCYFLFLDFCHRIQWHNSCVSGCISGFSCIFYCFYFTVYASIYCYITWSNICLMRPVVWTIDIPICNNEMFYCLDADIWHGIVNSANMLNWISMSFILVMLLCVLCINMEWLSGWGFDSHSAWHV